MQACARIRNRPAPALAAVVLALSAPLSALSPEPPQPDDELLPLLYETLDGENWRRNDGWLDPQVHWCDWYGVVCGEQFWPGLFELDAIELPGNDLSGEMTERLSALLFRLLPAGRLIDLSDNRISGQLDHFPLRTQQVDLSGNRFSGPLPGFEDEVPLIEDRRLLLARNDFEGAVPDSWQQLDLGDLDLADNRLDAGHLNAFGAVSSTEWSRLDLAGNRFSGELSTDILSARLYTRDIGNMGGGLNLCFNDFLIDNPEVAQWVADRHVGGPDYEQCLARERQPVGATVSGSWFHPERAGEGVALMLLENGAPLLYHFGFDTQGRQQWLFEVGLAGERFFEWDWLLETQGSFNAGLRFDGDHPFVRGLAGFRMDRVAADRLHLQRHYHDLSGCGPWDEADPDQPPPELCVPPVIGDRMDYQRLTGLAGVSCDSQSSVQQYSGAWYSPDRVGEGFLIEVLPNRQALVYWFTYKPDGSREQTWLVGQGEIESHVILAAPAPGTVATSLVVDPVLQPTGGRYGPEFDPAEIRLIEWGRIEFDLEIVDADHPVFRWDSAIEGYGSGSYELERLARPMLADCEDGGSQ